MFEIKISPDSKDIQEDIKLTLKNNHIEFSSYENVYIQKTEESIPTILNFIFNFKTGVLLIAAIKYISPLIIEYIKSRKSIIDITFNEYKLRIESNTTLKQIKQFIEDMEEKENQKNQ